MKSIYNGGIYDVVTVGSVQAEIPAWMTNAKKAASKMKEYDEATFEYGNEYLWESWGYDKETGKRFSIRLRNGRIK